MESTNSAFSANETALDPNSAGCCADKYQDAVSPEFDLAQRRAAAQVDAKGKYEPYLSEHGIPSDVLAKLLPGDDVVELVVPKVNGGPGYRFIKRAFDVASCGCALIVLAIPMAIIAAKIKLESYGPVIYSQRRVGKNGKIFNVYKFRSMYTDAETRGARWAAGNDPRVDSRIIETNTRRPLSALVFASVSLPKNTVVSAMFPQVKVQIIYPAEMVEKFFAQAGRKTAQFSQKLAKRIFALLKGLNNRVRIPSGAAGFIQSASA